MTGKAASVNSNGGESEAIHFIWQNLSWCYLLRASSFSSCPYLVVISATPSVVPATLCNTGEFKNSLAIKMLWVFFFWEPDLLIRFTEHGCWNSCAGATEGWQTDSVVGTGRDGGAARQQWNRTHGWWRIHLESHRLGASSFSASAPSAFCTLVVPSSLYEDPSPPFWGYTSEHLSLPRLCAGWSWAAIYFEILPRPLTYGASEESYLQEPPYPFSYKLAISLGLVMNLKQTSLCPVGWVWKENLWFLKLVPRISSHLSSFWCIILSCWNRFVLA